MDCEKIFFTALLSILLVPIGIILPLVTAYAGFFWMPGLWAGWEVVVMFIYCFGAPIAMGRILWMFWNQD